MYEIKFKNGELKIFDSLVNADLTGADLTKADLRRADLRDADLRGADLRGADLRLAIGNKEEVRSMQIEKWDIVFTKDVLAIGCQQHSIEKWRNFTDSEIHRMDSYALDWWKKWKDFVFMAIE